MHVRLKHKVRTIFSRTALLALFAMVTLFLLAPNLTANAQTRSQDKAYLKAGIKSLSDGKAKTAVEQLSKAISSGKLSEKDMAQALFRRGEAYRQTEQHGLAIADLTNSLYLNALPEKDKEKAYLERARAFASLGMQSQTSADIKSASGVAAANKSTEVPAKPVVAAPAAAPTVAAPAAQVALNKPATPQTTPAPAAQPIGSIAAQQSQQPAVSAPAAPPAPATPTPPQTQNSGFNPIQSVTNFFENLIPESQPAPTQQAQVPPAPAPTSSPSVQPVAATPQERPVWMADPSVTTPQPVPEVAANGSQPNAQIVEGWNNSTQVNVAKVKAQPRPANVPTPKRKPATSSDIVGTIIPAKPKAQPQRKQVAAVAPKVAKKYHLQLAKAASPEEAGRVWTTLATSHPHLLSGLTPTIQQTGIAGSQGAYLVGLGPFSNKTSTARICQTFKQQGLPCQVISQ